jgi:hypothetical protein
VALVGLVPTVAFGILGTLLAEKPQEALDYVSASRPFIPGQPVGLNNRGNNCWLNSSLQLLSHVPSFQARMRQIPELNQFLDSYAAAGALHNKVSPDIDSHQIRQALSRLTGGQIQPGPVQEDPAQLFEYLFQGPNTLYRFDQQLNGNPSTARREPMIQLEIPRGAPIPGFEELFNGFFNSRTDMGQNQQLFFADAPRDLLIQQKRFYREPNGTEGKINDAIQAPENLSLPARFVRSGENATYECDAFLEHRGVSHHGGHYVAYLKIDGSWWYISDSTVNQVSSQDASKAMAHSYIVHYTKS